jgi:hypothetical protein
VVEVLLLVLAVCVSLATEGLDNGSSGTRIPGKGHKRIKGTRKSKKRKTEMMNSAVARTKPELRAIRWPITRSLTKVFVGIFVGIHFYVSNMNSLIT